MKNLLNKIIMFKKDFFVLRKNKELMADKIMDYSPSLKEGILKYKNICLKFLIAAIIGILMNRYIIISVTCFAASIYFIVLMIKYTKYSMVNKIINKLANDITFRGIYDKEKIDYMLYSYKNQFGQESFQYEELHNIIIRYEKFVLKLGYIIRDIEIESFRKYKENKLLRKYTLNKPDLDNCEKNKDKKNEVSDTKIKIVENKNSSDGIIYSEEDGKIRKAKKVVDFFEENDSTDTVILKNTDNRKNMTIFLYKKSGELQNNVL